MTSNFYVTTPIYYPSANLHIGHAYTTVAADALARYHRRRGHETWFLTGTDEHGQNIERKAAAAGKSPQEYVDEIAAGIKHLWQEMHISYDDFIRTSEDRHARVVQQIFTRLYEQGDLYKTVYEGWYCTPCETFWLESKLLNGKCPDCDRPVEWTQEESYKFRLSKCADRLLQFISENPSFIQPECRRNEMVAFIKQGLEDLSVSRTAVRWGIPVPFDPTHTIYVWLDALSNYITALGYGTDHDDLYRKFWPANVHLMGKEIVRFHAIIWPIILMALDLPLPQKVFGHGWFLFGVAGEKMSKSRGNVVDPLVLIPRYGVDRLRYYLLREVPFGADGNYTEDALVLRTNVDLSNDLGNLLSRTTQMINRFTNGIVPAPQAENDDGILRQAAEEALAGLEQAMENLQISDALSSLWKLANRANKYIEEQAPWALAKEPAKAGALATVLYNLVESLRILGVALTPFLVETPEKIWEQLGLDPAGVRNLPWEQAARWGSLPVGTVIRRGQPIFPRLETESAPADSEPPAHAAAPVPTPSAPAKQPEAPEGVLIDYKDFSNVQLRVARVVVAEKIPNANNLLRLEVEVGIERRQIVSGIAQHYAPEALLNRLIVIVANLKPLKLHGVESQGMLLAASTNEGKLVLVTLDGEIQTGAQVR